MFVVTTPDFAGPMDLLVYIVRRRELDVAYISISAIASDYLEWLDRMELTELDSAGDFILLAATLLQFKALNLLPGEEPEISEAEMNGKARSRSDEELAAMRSTISQLAEMEAKQINLFNRGSVQIHGLDEALTGDLLADVSAYDLALAFRDIIYHLPLEPTHVIEDVPFSLEGQIAFILSFFESSHKVAFELLAQALSSRLAVIMTFLAMLELIRMIKIKVVQYQPFGPLWLILLDTN